VRGCCAGAGISARRPAGCAGLGEAGYQLSDAQGKKSSRLLNCLTGLNRKTLGRDTELRSRSLSIDRDLVDPTNCSTYRQEHPRQEEFGDAWRP
jgi:hypothetical protein